MNENGKQMGSQIKKYIGLGIVSTFIMLVAVGVFYLSQYPILLKQEAAVVSLKSKYDAKDMISYVFFGKPKDVEITTNVNTDKIGMYVTTYSYRNYSLNVNVEVRDNVPPILILKNYSAGLEEEVTVDKFIQKVKDDTEVVTEIDYMEKKGNNTYSVIIKATDESGNVTKKQATLTRKDK